ncbi:MAG: AraC family transcriptional regulator, partial [Spirochaetia bacterium]|nr:AraC family transcriptional regulator [Spirochaetia bacterium]
MVLRNLNFHIQLLDETYRFGGHAHAGRFEIILGLSGALGIQVGKKIRYLRASDLFVIPEGVFHHFWEAESKAGYFFISFESDLELVRRLASVDKIYRLPFRFSEAAGNAGRWSPEEAMSFLLDLLLTAEKEDRRGESVAEPQSLPRPTFESGVANAIAELVEKDPEKNHNLESLGKIFGLGKNYLVQRVKKATGHTAMDLYYRVKIDLAKTYLRQGLSSVEIASRLGFSNPYHFSRKFKQIAGQPPS